MKYWKLEKSRSAISQLFDVMRLLCSIFCPVTAMRSSEKLLVDSNFVLNLDPMGRGVKLYFSKEKLWL